MKLALYQYAPKFAQKQANLDKVRAALSSLDCDLLILPELALTGYQFTSVEETADLSEPVPDGHTCGSLVRLAASANCHIICGLPENARGTLYNSAVLVGPGGYVGTYRKAHLFCEEKSWFAPGDTGFQVFDIGLTRVGILICFDWLFPEAARILAIKGAQIIAHPSNLVLPWCQKVALARAFENKVFFATTNRTGTEARGGRTEMKFTGQSQVVTPGGEILFRLTEDEEAIKVVEIDPAEADNKAATPRNNIFTDRRTKLYHPLLD